MPTPRPPLPASLARGPFLVSEGRAAGLTPAQLRRRSLRAPTRGVRTGSPAPEPSDVARRCRDVLPSLPDDALFCHVTALALLQVPVPAGLDASGPLHVQVGPGSTAPRRRGFTGHRRSDPRVGSLAVAGGVPVLAPEQVWVQLAAELDVGRLVVLGDALTCRKHPISAGTLLHAAATALPPGTRGRRRLLAALAEIRPGTDSPMETRLRLLLTGAGLPDPLVNHPVHAPDGRFLALPDLSYPAQRVAVEYDGDVHRTDRRTWRRDIARRQALESHGWRVITCTADDVLRHPDRPVAWVRAALERPSRMQ
ncbi:hypothetical protein CHO01_24510 [Cellulomonas hominis]|uniref:DUF559 domain-containing protein n=1 Tax=Cellulomonas hominis TaxID=156981 RepID=A0A511FDK5_9CELL|nr:DUF559 domain-containing protein [Cellulomonas hominis]GEL47335.1 hypothetical protein CHO01_24510 [Cellulomonas hominis]